jgi:hypothetical protein
VIGFVEAWVRAQVLEIPNRVAEMAFSAEAGNDALGFIDFNRIGATPELVIWKAEITTFSKIP